MRHLRSIVKHGGIAFIIVRFISFNETYYLSADDLFYYLDNFDRKSIPHSYFKEKGYLIVDKYNPRVDYLSIVDSLYFKEAV